MHVFETSAYIIICQNYTNYKGMQKFSVIRLNVSDQFLFQAKEDNISDLIVGRN